MAKEVKLPIGKRVNIDQKLADRLADYRFARRIGSENQAIRELLELGLEVAEKRLERGPAELVSEAKALLNEAVRMRLAPIFELSGEVMQAEQDPDKLLRSAQELFTDEGQLRGLRRGTTEEEK